MKNLKKLKFENADFQLFKIFKCLLEGKIEKIENLRFLINQDFLKIEKFEKIEKY